MRLISVALIVILIGVLPFLYQHSSAEQSMVRGMLNVVHAQEGEQPKLRSFVVIVSRFGFNATMGMGGPMMGQRQSLFNITVNEGDRVRITFVYGDTDMRVNNPHVITIDGYNIASTELNLKNRQDTIEFTAGQVGEFKFYCSIPCTGMDNLQAGVLFTRLALTADINTRLLISPSKPDHSDHSKPLALQAQLRDEMGGPIEGVMINFLEKTRYGYAIVASSSTNKEGLAVISYEQRIPRTAEITAIFGGSGKFRPSNSTLLLQSNTLASERDDSPWVSRQNLFVDLRVVGVPPHVGFSLVLLLSIVVGSVWLTYAYVAKQIFNILRERRKEGESL